MDIQLAIICFIIGFIIANGIKFLHFRRNTKRISSKTGQNLIRKDINELAFSKLLPYIPIYYLVIWIVCSSFYFSNHTSTSLFYDGLSTGITWLSLSFIFETGVWVLLKHKLSISMKQMYLKSQPWILLSYYIVLVSPLMLAFTKM